ncbi:hypothetical protein XENOCAPTIV_024908 [Xenoophorus captivus]|uniref:Uncharacterized protein n=1 Tax=Xenoophorus captivus TaxID=1517983 RepID=A0ABV0QTF5_9TELE
MRRFACGVTSESHELYPTFMKQLSHCIFEVDSGDARRLTEAKRSDLGRKHGMVGLSDAEVVRRISKEEWRLHCRRRTRGAENTALSIQNIWDTQRRHLSCIQDPPGVQLYTQTGTLTKGGISLPVYRCARGSTSLESFHLHLHSFIPGKGGCLSEKHKKLTITRSFAFLVDGVVRWNEDRAAAPADAAETRMSLHSYSGHLKHALNQKSQRVLGHQMVEDFTKPAAYTGELIRLEYLFRQTGSVFEEINMDPDAPVDGAAVSTLEDEDEGHQWLNRRQKQWERSVLEHGVSIVPAPAVAEQPLLPAKELSLVRVVQGQHLLLQPPRGAAARPVRQGSSSSSSSHHSASGLHPSLHLLCSAASSSSCAKDNGLQKEEGGGGCHC